MEVGWLDITPPSLKLHAENNNVHVSSVGSQCM